MRYFILGTAMALMTLSGATTGAGADQALVVGVNHYSQLPDDARLGGSINDATLIATKLKGLGFNVTQLGDTTATKQGVLDALTRMVSNVKPNERFVFYFAGHGSKMPDGKGVILPSDASPAGQDNYITQTELYDKVNAIQARGRTILLDSCFSGAMTRGLKGLAKNRKARFYNFFSLHQKKITLIGVNNADVPNVPKTDDPAVTTNPDNPTPAPTSPICYFVAATNAQRAYEDDFDGKSDGVFTHFLATRLSPTREQWAAVQSDVAVKVADSTEQTQSPILSPAFASIAVFEGLPQANPTTPPAPPAPHRKVQSVWQTFNENHANKDQISLELTPNVSSIAIGEKFHFNVTIGSGQGYLVVMELDTDGNIDLLYPSSRNVDDCAASAGMIKLPADPALAYTVDKEGQERVRAILFRSKTDAADLLSKFPPDGTIESVSDAMTRSIKLTSAAPDPFYTSSLDFEVIAASKKAQLQNNTGE